MGIGFYSYVSVQAEGALQLHAGDSEVGTSLKFALTPMANCWENEDREFAEARSDGQMGCGSFIAHFGP